ncbi:MAG: DUF6989 domain-containing protein [Janthinobacterium lividum]
MKTILEDARLRTILGTIALSVMTVIFLRDRPWSDGRTALLLNSISIGVFLWHIAYYKDRVMARLLLFGFTLGVAELAADALCVRFTHTLDYSVAHSLMLGLSPFWMPTAWMVVAAQIGYLGSRLIAKVGTGKGMALTALLGAVNIPFYEEMAYHAHWWRYQNCRKIGHTPVYIIVAELVIGLTLGPLAAHAMSRGSTWRDAVLAGLIGGISTIWGGLIGYGLVERLL